ncbi:hypothetical protein C8J56DRAFT_895408 [Mycena floridula]|nr:hypothetical protein C8J56DRAFT_895408 [Mycena floridula]
MVLLTTGISGFACPKSIPFLAVCDRMKYQLYTTVGQGYICQTFGAAVTPQFIVAQKSELGNVSQISTIRSQHHGSLSSCTTYLSAENLDSPWSPALNPPATNPALPAIVIISPILPGLIVVFPSRLGGVTMVRDVLGCIHSNMNRPYEEFGMHPGLVPQYRKPRKWLDLFEGRVQFMGLRPSEEPDTWVIGNGIKILEHARSIIRRPATHLCELTKGGVEILSLPSSQTIAELARGSVSEAKLFRAAAASTTEYILKELDRNSEFV